MDVLDIMCDLETLDNGSNSAIIQIAAKPFNMKTGELINGHFNVLINPQTCVKLGLKISGETVAWWLSQDNSVVNKVFVKSIQEGEEIKVALTKFNQYLLDLKKEHKVKQILLWGNGVLADNRWLADAMKMAGIKPAWSYQEDADVRTLVDLGKRILNIDPKKDMVFNGEKHNAIDDCIHQIKYCSKIYEELQKLTKKKEKKKT